MDVYLGIEGGATHTVALWVDSLGQEVVRAEFGCGNVRLLRDEQLISLFKQIQQAGKNFAYKNICAGFAGAVNDADKARVLKIGQSVFGDTFSSVYSDLQTPLYAADIGKNVVPILVLSGTGSCCYTEWNSEEIKVKSGGYGHLLGDRGSGYQIGCYALREVLKFWDAYEKLPPLGDKIMLYLLANQPDEWINWSLRASKKEIAGLAKIVCQAAQYGCAVALQVLRYCAEEIAQDAFNCYSRLFSKLPETEKIKSPCFIFSGSVLLKSSLYRDLVRQSISSRISNASFIDLDRDSVYGAVRKALHGKEIRIFEKEHNVQKIHAAVFSPTEMRNPRSAHLDTLSTQDAVELMINEESYTQKALLNHKAEIAEIVERVSTAFKNGGRLVYCGAGTSGRLGVLDASECPPTFGVDYEQVQGVIAGGYQALWRAAEGAEDSADAGAKALECRNVSAKDVVIGIAASGTTPFVRGALQYSKSCGAFTVLLCFNPNRKPYLGEDPDRVLAMSLEPEILTGSTRLKSGTATKLILNIITTLSMVRNGKVISNLMVDVKATNEKLRDRAIRILMELTGWDRQKSQESLEMNEWSIRKAFNARK